MGITNRFMNGDPEKRRKQSEAWSRVLEKQLALLSEHYRQPISKLSMIVYAQDLQNLTPERLEAACIHVRRTSEFMPVSAAILKADDELQKQAFNGGEYLGPRLLAYPAIDPAERATFIAELEKDPAYQAARASLMPAPRARRNNSP